MPNAPGKLWADQAASDFHCAERVYDNFDHTTYCHVVAKYQQTVEKSIKGMFVAAREAGILANEPKFTHSTVKLIAILSRLPRAVSNKDIQNQITGLLNEFYKQEISALEGLAPSKPDEGELARRNTEYPYQNADGSWRIPSEINSFALKDIERFRRIAHEILQGSQRIISEISRRP